MTPAGIGTAKFLTNSDLPANLHPKTVAAWLWPTIATALAAVIMWIGTGEFNEGELRLALAGELSAILAGLGAYFGRQVPAVDPTVSVTGTEDDLPRHTRL